VKDARGSNSEEAVELNMCTVRRKTFWLLKCSSGRLGASHLYDGVMCNVANERIESRSV
jgi:hypothetical protein